MPRAGSRDRRQDSIQQSRLVIFYGIVFNSTGEACAIKGEKVMKTREDEMREQCEKFHAEHPEVWELFVRFAKEKALIGFKHYSAMAVFQRVRWETDTGGDGVSTFKLNNNYVPFYARRFMRMYPHLDGFFRTRRQTSASKPATNLPELTPEAFA